MSTLLSLRIQLLGNFRVLDGDKPIGSVNTPRLQSLLAYLVLHRDAPHLRQHLAFQFWPDSSESQARTNLRKLIFELQHALPYAEHFLQADTQTIGWNPNAPLWLDVAELQQRLTHLQADPLDLDGFRQVAELYHGQLLPSCYEDWIAPLRQALHQQVMSALERLITLLENQRAYDTGIYYAQRLLAFDPLEEKSYQRLMRLHALEGDYPGALRIYQECVAVLQRELEVEPDAETKALYARLRQRDPALASKSEQKLSPTERFPLVGRQREWQILQDAWRKAMQGQAHFVWIWGEAGIGKTRLAEELLVWASQQGILTARTRSYAVQGALAYAPVTTLLRSPILYSRLLKLGDLWLTQVARLLPELLEERPTLPPPKLMTESWQRQRFLEALARVVLADDQPLLLVFDDLHWCDQETLEWLPYLLHFAPQARLLIVGTSRAEEVADDHPLTKLRLSLRREALTTEIELNPLSAAEVIALAQSIGDADLSREQTQQLYADTEGNPLFIVELVRAGLVAGLGGAKGGQGNALPPTVQAVIAARLAQLSPVARQLVQVAATIGRAFSMEVLLAVASDTSEDALVQGLDELWQRRIVREQSKQGYDFSHDKIRDVAYAQLPPARRKLLHRRVAQALERLYATNLDEVSGQVAGHYEQAGLEERAFGYYQRAAQGAQRLHANQEALRYYQQALALAQGEAAYHGILTQRAQVYLDLYRGKAAASDFQQLLNQARQAGNREQELEFLLGLVDAYYLVALDDQATDTALKLRELYATTQSLARELGNKRNRVLSLLLPIWHFWPEDRAQAMADAKEAFALSCELGDEALMLDSKLALLYSASELEQAAVGDNGLLEELQARGDLDRLNQAYFYLMWTHYLLGNFDRAVSLCDAGIELAAKLGVSPVMYPTLKAFALLGLGQYGAAWEALQQEIADDAHPFGRTFKETGIGLYLFEVGAYRQSAVVLEQVVVQAEQLRRGWLREFARLRFVRALLRAGQGGQADWASAAQALADADQNVLQGLKHWQGLALALQAELALAQGRQAEALRHLQAANAIMAANRYQGELAAAWELQARVLLQLQRSAEALALLDEALLMATAIGCVPLAWRIHATKAQTLEKLGQTEAAAQEWQTAAAIIQRLAATISQRELQQGFLSEPLIAAIVDHTQNQHANQGGR